MTTRLFRTTSLFALTWAVYFTMLTALAGAFLYGDLFVPAAAREQWTRQILGFSRLVIWSFFVMAAFGAFEFVLLRRMAAVMPAIAARTRAAAFWLVISVSVQLAAMLFFLSINVEVIQENERLMRVLYTLAPFVNIISWLLFAGAFALWRLRLAQIADESHAPQTPRVGIGIWRRLASLPQGTRNWWIILADVVLMQVLWAVERAQPDRYVFFAPLDLALRLFIVYALMYQFVSLRRAANQLAPTI